MTECEWLSCHNPIAMLNFLKAGPNDRKVLLLLLAYLDRIWEMTAEGPISDWAAQARLAVEGRGDAAAYQACEEEMGHHMAGCRPGFLRPGVSPWAYEALCSLFFFAQAVEDEWEAPVVPEEVAEDAIQADYLREIFGNPFRPVTFSPAYLTHNVLTMARVIYNQRAFDRLPELGEALEAAGCDDAAILAHCRWPEANHVRGCWVVDLILGKA